MEKVRHKKGCFHTKYFNYQKTIKNELFAGQHDLLVSWSKRNGYEKAPYGMAIHCTCRSVP